MKDGRRVVVTGMGLRTPIGNSLVEFSQGLQAGRSGVRRMPEWEQIQNLRTRVAGLVDLSAADDLPRKHRRGMGRVALLYQTQDGAQSGAWNQTTRSWETLDDSYSSSVRNGIRMARQQMSVDLLNLPVPGPEAK